MNAKVDFTLSYVGNAADQHQIDFYDVAEALQGFQRSIALTANLVLNGTIITQAPSLKNAKILAVPPEAGSWKWTAILIAATHGFYTATTADKDTVLSHMVRSTYDYVVSQTLGFHIDFDSTLGKQYDELKKERPDQPPINEANLDSLIEKCEGSIKSLHRPIIASKTASGASIYTATGPDITKISADLSRQSFEYVDVSLRDDRPAVFNGRVSSYNINTFKGRLFEFQQARPIPFEMPDFARTRANISLLTESLSANAIDRTRGHGDLEIVGFAERSKTGRLKKFLVIDVRPSTFGPTVQTY